MVVSEDGKVESILQGNPHRGGTRSHAFTRGSQLPASPGKVILAIFTDGQENASRTFTAQHINDLIRLYRDEIKSMDTLLKEAENKDP